MRLRGCGRSGYVKARDGRGAVGEEELPEAPIQEHIVELGVRIKRIAVAILVSAAVLSAIPYSLSPYTPLVAAFPRLLIDSVVPENITFLGKSYEIELVQFNPFAGFNIIFLSTMLLGILGASPVIAKEVAEYLAPALYRHERELLRKYAIAAFGLFVLGVVMAYFIVIPWALRFLFVMSLVVAGEKGLIAFADIEKLFSLIVKLMVATGMLFEVPLLVYMLIVHGIVDIDKFRGDGLKYAFIGSLILGALISPDPTGVGMLMLAIPYFALLYLAVKLAERRVSKHPQEGQAHGETSTAAPPASLPARGSGVSTR